MTDSFKVQVRVEFIHHCIYVELNEAGVSAVLMEPINNLISTLFYHQQLIWHV